MKSDKAKKVTTREYMMKLIYQANVTKEGLDTLEGYINTFLDNNAEYIVNRYEELRLQYSSNPNLALENLSIENAIDKDYMKQISKFLSENIEAIDQLINKYSKNWSIERMPKVDLSILRLSVCEMMFLTELPKKVSINEAVELAKIYCDDKAPKFINGILGSVVNEIGQ